MSQHSRKSQLGRADLLEAIATNNEAAIEYLSQQLELTKQSKVSVKTVSKITTATAELKINKSEFTLDLDTELPPKMSFCLLESREPALQQQGIEQTPQTVIIDWPPKDALPPVFYPLSSARSLLARLFHHLKHQRQGRKLDIDKVIKKLGQGEHLLNFPKLSHRSLGQHLHIIDDRHLHLTPYWQDHSLFSDLIASLLPDYASSVSILQNSHSFPRSLNDSGDLSEWKLPPQGSVVLVFSDLGALSLNPALQIQIWLTIAKRLQQQHCKLIALIPTQVHECDARLQSLFILESWEVLPHLQPCTQIQRLKQAEFLLTLLAPAIRLEPALLRAVRKSLSVHDIYLDAAVEALVWQHPKMQESSSVAATFNIESRKAWLEKFHQQDNAIQKTVLKIIRSWRLDLQKQVWFEEIISLNENAHQHLPKQDLEAALHYLQQLLNYHDNGCTLVADIPTQLWLRRMEKRLMPSCYDLPNIGILLQQISTQLHKDDVAYHSQHPLDPAKLAPVNLPEQTAILYQHQQCLMIAKPSATEALLGYSRLGLIRYRTGRLYIKIKDKQAESFLFQASALEQPQMISNLVNSGGFLLRSDVETLHFSDIQRPDCFQQLGRDLHSLYADVKIKSISQRFRWIEAGSFMMGSAEHEVSRYDDEDLHHVTLSQGFWLADTVVTQALWQAVMDNNPSHFSNDLNNPVENVSWNDAQTFIDKLNHLIPEIHACLPSEAQWEYACRAGTQTAFSFGDNITPEQVNYNGNFPYADAEKGKYRQRTLSVKSLPANDWGLYEMHGNVWEWCLDVWQKNLGKQAVINPVQDNSSSSARVVRGGSWGGDGQYARSASRFRLSAGFRSFNQGFRLSLGLQVKYIHAQPVAFGDKSGWRVSE